MLRKRSLPFPSSQVTWVARILLSTLGSPGEKEGEDPEKSVTEPEKEPAAGPAEEGGPGPSKNHSLPLSGPHAGPNLRPPHVRSNILLKFQNTSHSPDKGETGGCGCSEKLLQSEKKKITELQAIRKDLTALREQQDRHHQEKDTSHLDHHLTTHTELTKAAQRDALQACKRRKILEDLASLRASNPEEPMVSTLDLDEPRTSGMFLRPRKRNVATRGARRSQVTRVARNLLSSLSSPGEKEGKGPEKSISEPEKEPATGPAEEEGPGPSKNHNLLKSDPEKKHQWSFYGHLTTYWASIYGHRSGVFQNLTIQEVVEARQRASEGCFVIEILAHKTNQAFGAAQLALDQEEYVWLEQFLSIRSTLVGGNDTKYFFFTSKPSSCKNLNQYFQEAWASMGLPGTPTFTDMRTTIATHAKNTHTPEEIDC
ncbi:hypothetical protein ROHU_009064 [Labeo rohita]|uniref:Uncharacterized protein n=1 Tax=Labeo rohita TaxID=84645 RepID=A0A498M1V1_LABRO|nr:hypothetical protein ROHU_009062 [Labeo rohita]RXN14521.1 hypothetical protein ROHU_009064 [Labeo rohita]